jgi:lipopolysaccharide/colanic/teichoic acid biosynthesis glycosyltransferase
MPQTLRSTIGQVHEPQLEVIKSFRQSSWCRSRRKRCFDVLVATALLIPVAPLIPLIILLVKLDSPGPAFFVKHRVGMGGEDFPMFKFRTMEHEKRDGIYLTRAGDMRITRVGRLLRKWKLDEIPQLWNVIRGDMSIVGPRPHMRRLLGNSLKLRDFLSIRPGVTGAATVHFRHEEQILPRISELELETYYIQNILPRKMRLDMDYASKATFWSDFKMLLSTFGEVALPHGSEKTTETLAQPRWSWLAPADTHRAEHRTAEAAGLRREATAAQMHTSARSVGTSSSSMPVA